LRPVGAAGGHAGEAIEPGVDHSRAVSEAGHGERELLTDLLIALMRSLSARRISL
jgi:hypothetical protein